METIEKHFEGLSECRLPPEAADYGYDDRTWDGSRWFFLRRKKHRNRKIQNLKHIK